MNFDELIVGFMRNALREKLVGKYSPCQSLRNTVNFYLIIIRWEKQTFTIQNIPPLIFHQILLNLNN